MVSALLLISCTLATAQTVADEILAQPARSAGIAYSLPVGMPYANTPPPKGMKPFYISHYGTSAAFYLEDSLAYLMPIATLAKADSLDCLTGLGRDVLHRLRLVYNDARNRSGELTAKGALQMRQLAQELVDRTPEVFTDSCVVDARSIVRNHNIMSMQEAMTQIARYNPHMELRLKSSHSNDAWMDVRDTALEATRFNAATTASLQAFRRSNIDNRRLLQSLFASPNYVSQHVDADTFCDQLFQVVGTIQSTPLDGVVTPYDIFTPQELYQHWRVSNAKNYVSYGQYLPNGSQAFAQRAPLWNLLHVADSIKHLDHPVVHLRFSSRTMLLSLVSLMELNGYGLQTANLDSLDKAGWADYRIAPYGSSVQVVHYRSDKSVDDILIKVLLNGQEVQLPIDTDCAPYYNWNQVKRYYLRKLYAYEKSRIKY